MNTYETILKQVDSMTHLELRDYTLMLFRLLTVRQINFDRTIPLLTKLRTILSAVDHEELNGLVADIDFVLKEDEQEPENYQGQGMPLSEVSIHPKYKIDKGEF